MVNQTCLVEGKKNDEYVQTTIKKVLFKQGHLLFEVNSQEENQTIIYHANELQVELTEVTDITKLELKSIVFVRVADGSDYFTRLVVKELPENLDGKILAFKENTGESVLVAPRTFVWKVNTNFDDEVKDIEGKIDFFYF